MADYDLALGIKPPQIDVATPLLTAAKIRAADQDAQRNQMEIRKEGLGQLVRGLMPYANSPDFPQRWAQMHDVAYSQGLIPSSAMSMRDSPSVLGLQSLYAQTAKPELIFHQEEAKRAQSNADRAFELQQAQFEEQKRQHGEAENKPVSVSAGANLVSPKTGEVKFKGSDGLSEAATEITARQVAGGDLSGLTNIGRGAQGDAKLTAIKNKAAQILVDENGMTPAEAATHLSNKFQAFKAAGIGQNTEARTTAQREANLTNIIKQTEAAIPAALDLSEKVARTGWVPINKLIQGGQVMASSPELKEFGMANLQLAEHWARAMNPTGVMRESDRDLALHFLSTADSKETYKRAVMQLKLQVTRERDSLRPGAVAPSAPGATSAPAAPTGTTKSGVTWSVE